ncbi:MAG: hypothetical protein MR964_05790 [Campylobacter sp.]|uniref:hypothetical protein n=1 Tax=Campylobacter sp. TaxID=205 RepID=UPI002AA66E79|nr:hypothetical protein [Campylobacter sp.]MCI7023713.1 hypothetical protein [Campylobacter sp.]
MSYIYIIIAVLASGGYVAYSSYKISSLKTENQSLSQAIQVSLRANKELEIALSESEIEHQKNLEFLAKAKSQNEKERVYVEKIKYKIIKDNNGTCLNAINDVFSRLQQQTRDSNNTKAKSKERL